jgi:ubiquinone/menaquinone biosynthesis C-methylase UbiE
MGTGALKSYPIKGGEFGRNRLSVLARVLAPTTNTLLRRAGPLKGIKAVDAACGGGDVTFALARQVGPEGEVTGIDLDQEKLALARAHAKAQGIGNVNFEMADVTVAWPVTGVALVYGRFILTHLKEPHDLLKQARAVLKPNGVMLVEDIDIQGWFSYPECRALDRSFELYMALSRRRGGDPTIGRRLSLLMEAAGFEDVGTTVVQPFSRQGGAKDVATLSFAAIADGLKAEGLASAEEIAAISREMEAFNQSHDTIVSMPRIFQAWGRKT